MTLRVSGKNLSIGDALKQHVEDRIQAAVTKYFDGDISGQVVVRREGTGYRADCTLHLSSGVTLQSEGVAHEVYACFDQAAERLEKRLRRYKRKLKDHYAGIGVGAAPAEESTLTMTDYVLTAPEEDHEADYSPTVVAERPSRIKDMTVAMAVLELDMTGVPVIVFRHAGHGRVNLVYRRADGHVGWVDPGASEGASALQ